MIVDVDRSDNEMLIGIISRNVNIESLLCIERGIISAGNLSVGRDCSIGPGIFNSVGIGVVVDHDIHWPLGCCFVFWGYNTPITEVITKSIISIVYFVVVDDHISDVSSNKWIG